MDIVARLSGDEFVVVLIEPETHESVTAVAIKLIDILRQPMSIHEHNLVITSSIGVSLYPKDGQDYETLLKNADTAMYASKKAGRDSFMFYNPAMNVNAAKYLAIESALRNALKNNEFHIYYQPQINLESGQFIGTEALLRWHSAELGWVSPTDFIPLAEETGLIIPIGAWVLREACRQNANWHRQGLAAGVVAVNISAIQFRHSSMLTLIDEVLQDTGLTPCYLELELTESIVMDNAELALSNLAQLNRRGLKLAIDDFGTGYSSLSYLKRFAIDKLKIDQSFVFDIGKDTDDEAIIKAIISLAHSLNLRVIAEGVETQLQRDFLQAHHCNEMQGYLFSKPVPASGIEALLKA